MLWRINPDHGENGETGKRQRAIGQKDRENNDVDLITAIIERRSFKGAGLLRRDSRGLNPNPASCRGEE